MSFRLRIGFAMAAAVSQLAAQTLFTPPNMVPGNAPYQWPDAPAFALVVDIDGNGALDLVTGAIQSNRLDTFLGNGQGGLTYAATTIVPQPSVPPACCPSDHQWPVASALIDGDSLPDVICIVGDGIQPQLNLGNGTFQPLPILTGINAFQCQVSDLDGDGSAEVIALGSTQYGSTQGTLRVWSIVNGSFVPSFQHVGAPGGNLSSIALGDFNQDGLTDIGCYYLSAGPRGLVFFIQGAGLNFTPVGPIPVPASASQCPGCFTAVSGLYATDLNLDGLPDVVATGVQWLPGLIIGTIWVFPGAPGVLVAAPTIRMPTGFAGQTIVGQTASVRDVDLDGLDDLVFPQINMSSPDVFRLGGIASTSTGFKSAQTGYALGSTTFVSTGDFDGDGDADLVYARDIPFSGTAAVGVALNRSRDLLACSQASTLGLEKGTANPGNGSFALSITGAAPGAAVAFGLASAQGGWYSGGCAVHLSLARSDLILPTPDYGLSSASAAGTVSLALPVPNNPGLLGLTFYAQAIAVDAAGSFNINGVGFAVSDLRTILIW